MFSTLAEVLNIWSMQCAAFLDKSPLVIARKLGLLLKTCNTYKGASA
ncbi:hypothetical protein SAMN05428967_3498 [Phyllobacterium sp. YR620]|nr:hypothetical protein SAMN05428967_3498 [Phyllobacterium sp. YR620]